MSSFEGCKISKLQFKTGPGVEKKKKKVKKHKKVAEETKDPDSDSEIYEGWWQIKSEEVFTHCPVVSIHQGSKNQFWRALDNGKIVLGPSHDVGEGPAPEEQFTVIRLADSNTFGIKTGFMKYISVAKDNTLQGICDAIGPRESFQTIFQDGKTALICGNSCFASVEFNSLATSSNSKELISASAFKVTEKEEVKLRCNSDRKKKDEKSEQDVDLGRLDVAELSYVKKYQSFQNRKVQVNSEDRCELKKAREEGKLHEALLDRRSKMKHDKFC